MPVIGNLVYLLAALGVLIPIAIHLWNRKPPRVIAVGSIRWMKGSSTRSARRLKFEQWPLLLLRCLMLLLFSLLLASLYWERSPQEGEEKIRRYLIHEQELQGMRAATIDSIEAAGWQMRLLAPGMPPLADSLQWRNRRVDIWGVMREADMDARLADTLRLRSPLLQAYFSGERPRLHKTYLFEAADYPEEISTLYSEAIRLEEGVFLQQALAAGDRIWYHKDTLSLQAWEARPESREGELRVARELKVSILADAPYTRDARMIHYALEAVAAEDVSIRLEFNEAAEEAAGCDLLIWLAAEEVPAHLLAEHPQLITYAPQVGAGADWLTADFSNVRQPAYQLTARPLPEAAEREKLYRLPIELARFMHTDKEFALSDYLPMPEEQASPLKATGSYRPEKRTAAQDNLHLWLWSALFSLFVIERIWVYRN